MKHLPIIVFAGLYSISSVYAMHSDHEEALRTADILRNMYAHQGPQSESYKNSFVNMGFDELQIEENKYKVYLETLNKLPVEQQTEDFKTVIQVTHVVWCDIRAAQYPFTAFMQQDYQNILSGMTLAQLKQEETLLKTEKEKINTFPQDLRPKFDVVIQRLDSGLAEIQQTQYTKMSFIQRHPKLIILGCIGLGAALAYVGYNLFNNETPDTEDQPLDTQDHAEKEAIPA